MANQKICLRLGLNIRRQFFRGERWIVIEDPFTNQFFRLRPAAYEFVARLRPDKTIEEVWRECLGKFPDEAPGQGTVIQLLSQLYQSNLLQYGLATDTKALFERYKKRRDRETRARWMQILFMRMPLIDPDQFLLSTLPFVGRLINFFGLVTWVGFLGYALKLVMDQFPMILIESQAVLSPANLPLLYISIIATKVMHEFGHAYFCRKFGGEVHVMGIMLLIFTPIPYMDATSSWRLRSQWQRLLVAAAGMIVEVFVASIAVIVWANTGQGTLHNLAYNMIFVASVSTLLFNINPLLRFDGYYMLSDLLGIPNLHQRAKQQLQHLVEKFLFGIKRSFSPAESLSESNWLTFFGITSSIYRVFVFVSILMFVADRFLLLGMIMLLVGLVTWFLVPLVKLFKYLTASERLERNRIRASCVSGGILAFILILLWFIPFPNHFRAPGVVEAKSWAQVIGDTSGLVEEIIAIPGEPVESGQPLFRLKNHELELALKQSQAKLNEVERRIIQALERSSADLKPLRSLRKSIMEQVNQVEENLKALTVRARISGTWVGTGIEQYEGRWLDRGMNIGILVNPREYEFVAIVNQNDADSLFSLTMHRAEVRLHGQAERVSVVQDIKVVPAEQSELPSAALGWGAGGEVATKLNDPQGQRAAEPFFRVSGMIEEADYTGIVHGRTGKIRFFIGYEPLLKQWLRRFWQLLQRRYQV